MKHGEYISDKRIVFKRGFQTRFLLTIKNGTGLTWGEIGKKFNVSEYTVRADWRYEKSTLPLNAVKNMLEMHPFIAYDELNENWIQKTMEPNWGQRFGKTKKIKQINISKSGEELAEIVGIVLGDGSISRKEIVIAKEYPIEKYYISYTQALVKKLFGIDSTIHFKKPNVAYIDIHSTILVDYFRQMGMKSGDKIANKTTIPEWILKEPRFIKSCLRGLFDTDGGIYHKQGRYRRAIIEFQTKSPVLSNDIKRAFDVINYVTSKSNMNVRIQNQQEIIKFFKEIGSSNPRNIIRFKRFVQHGIVPKIEEVRQEAVNYNVKMPFRAYNT